MSTLALDRTEPGYHPGMPDYRRVVGALFAAGLGTFALLYSAQALLPEFVTEFGVSSGSSTMALSVTTLGLGVALLVAGPVSDAIGRTQLIHLSLALSCSLALACAVAPTWEALLALRFLEGVALAGLPAVATAYLREELHASTHARAAGLYIGGTALGGMAGRLVTGPVGEVAGWRWALVSAALLGIGCAVAVRLLLPPSRHFSPGPSDVRTAVRMGRRALSDPALLALYGVGACTVGALVAAFNAVGFRLAEPPFGLGLAAASLVFLVYPLGTVSATLFGRLADRFGRRAVMPAGAFVAIVGVGVTLPDALLAVVAGLGLITVGFFAVHGVASGWVPARAHAGGVSTAQAASFYLFAYYLGSSVFGSLGGAAFARGGWALTAAFVALLLTVAGVLSLVLRRTPVLVVTPAP
ncbi:MFS transporter [Nocardioides humilatus]|uniref:MFS transporter n=1 Tax=Nocardioides humilatus TaxID=2607660 RepID=UPI001FE3B6D3|nr:MFS transporter [Nocardioides humilatus]